MTHRPLTYKQSMAIARHLMRIAAIFKQNDNIRMEAKYLDVAEQYGQQARAIFIRRKADEQKVQADPSR